MSDSVRAVCLHFHIFKNAGTTIDSVLEKNFLKNAVRVDIEKPKAIFTMDSVIDFLRQNPDIQSFSSHQIRFPLPNVENLNLIPMLFIRHPIDRIFSIYSYNKRRDDPRTPSAHEARIKTLKEYIKWSLEGETSMIMKNFQVMFLVKNEFTSNVNQSDFKLASDRIRNCLIMGVVDRLDASLVVAEETLRKNFPKIDLSYSPKNVSNDRIGTLQQKLEKGRSQIGEQLWSELTAKNEFDLKLYSLANKELNNRVKKIIDFDEKLRSFKDRINKNLNQKLQNSSMLQSRRIWYSPEKKLFYYQSSKKGTVTDFRQEKIRIAGVEIKKSLADSKRVLEQIKMTRSKMKKSLADSKRVLK